MSFILDALRKSDADRQRAVTPGLADVRYAARHHRRNVWLPILVVVLAANMVFMGLWWFGRGAEPPPAAAPAPVAVVGAPADPVMKPELVAELRPLAREAEFGEPQLEPEALTEFEPVAAATAPAPELPPVTPPATPTTPAPSRILANNDLPTAEQLIGSGTLKSPMLNLDLHVYSDQVANRFVIINSRKYREGGQLTEGPTVETINPEGVILAIQGRRFTLSSK